jgi:peptide subunit release factor RF-3
MLALSSTVELKFTHSTRTFTMTTTKRFHAAARLAIFSSLLALSACAELPQVRSSLDRTADFTQYKTFAFMNPLATDRVGYQSLVSQELKAATRREMEARGMRLVTTSPQLLVNFNAALVDKTRVSTSPLLMGDNLGFYGGGYYGYRDSWYSPWPQYAQETLVTNYKEGTLNVDVIDTARKQLVWEGVVTDSNVTQDELANLPIAINNAISAAFKKYPIQVMRK